MRGSPNMIFALSRRKFYFPLLMVLSILSGCVWVGGAFNKQPEDISQLSSGAKALIQRAYQGIDTSRLIDYHTHIIGLNPDKYGTFVNESWQNPLNITGYIRFVVYKSAAGITDLDKVDEQYIDRLVRLIKHLPHRGQFGLMAFDYFHDAQGRPDKKLSTFHVPNERMMQVVQQYPDYFFPIISVHPYRDDAVTELRKYAGKGVRFVKWLPNAMGINPDAKSPALARKLEDYYKTLVESGITLITHTGDEKAVEAESFQRFGNPLYLKKPLSMGVKIIMAHVASLGECQQDEQVICKPGTPYIDIAMEMLRDKRYEGRLYADISGVTQFNRWLILDKILAASDIHHKLVNGSDYPLPAVNFVIRTRTLVDSGHITADERDYLNEIYDVNPLLFDFVLKRTISHSVNKAKFQLRVFYNSRTP